MPDKYSLMIVDDEEHARRHILEDIPWNTLEVGPLYEAAGGHSALEGIVQHSPDILILDIRMPEMDGVELLERIMQLPHRPQIITLSGYSDFDAARKMLSSGIVVEYLLKPASEDEMFEAVYKCIERIDEKRPEPARVQPEEGLDAREPFPPLSHGVKRQTVERVKEYIQENYAKRMTLDMAARYVYVSPTYLSKLFSAVEGIGFSDYLSQVRVQNAKRALLDCRKRIYQVAEEVGYQDVKHFIKVFKKLEGMTPSQYRETQLLEF